ncbi:hypothetical protein PC118_g17951 [Phytophthora cactorum]|uniref:Uncharacterized protein n=1 Tax=Phytophthora cactorum TaxID=29920 RepID=A0A8T1F6E7_9STRA|nr:hypothetical protein PC118_g17951 [Phytophthora cactorum]
MMTGDAKATILAASTFRDLLEAIFVKFCMMTASLLQRELQAAHGPFLKLHHDGWSRGNGNVSEMGTSASLTCHDTIVRSLCFSRLEMLVMYLPIEVDGKDNEIANEKDKEAVQNQQVVDVNAAGNNLLVDAHREMYASLNPNPDSAAQGATTIVSLNVDLVPAADDEKVICGAAVQTRKPNAPPSSLHDQVSKILEEWRQYTVDWVSTAVLHSADDTKTNDDFTPLLSVRRNGVVCWRVVAICKRVDILRWFRETV